MISRIQFKDENMIDTGWPPAINIDAQQKQEEYEQQGTSVQLYYDIEYISKIVKKSYIIYNTK